MTPDNPLISLLGLGQQQQPLPPMGPVGAQQPQPPPQAQPQGQVDPTQQLTNISTAAQQQMAEQIQRMRGLSDQIQQRVAQQSAMQVPQMGPSNPILRFLSATAPGQAINRAFYGPEVGQYQAKSKALAEQIQELQTAQQREEEPLGAISGSIWHPLYAQGRIMSGEAAMMNAQTNSVYKQAEARILAQKNQIQADLGAKKITVEEARTRMMKTIEDERRAGAIDVANISNDKAQAVENVRAYEQQFSTESTHWLQDLMGTGPQAPMPPNKPAAKPTSSTPAATHRFVPGQGLLPTSSH